MATSYKGGDLVPILRTQCGPGLKLHPEFFVPYKIISILRNDRHVVKKIVEHDGPFRTSTSADHMKSWPTRRNPYFNPDFEANDKFEASDNNEDVIKFRMDDCGIQNPTEL